jgi:hypothetical protein
MSSFLVILMKFKGESENRAGYSQKIANLKHQKKQLKLNLEKIKLWKGRICKRPNPAKGLSFKKTKTV